jgi:hypothetical protein
MPDSPVSFSEESVLRSECAAQDVPLLHLRVERQSLGSLRGIQSPRYLQSSPRSLRETSSRRSLDSTDPFNPKKSCFLQMTPALAGGRHSCPRPSRANTWAHDFGMRDIANPARRATPTGPLLQRKSGSFLDRDRHRASSHGLHRARTGTGHAEISLSRST